MMNYSKNNIVLVADDSTFMRKIICQTLTKEGYKVEEARDGEETLEKCREIKPYILCLDITMPKKSGTEVIEELSKDPEMPNIVVCSAVGQEFLISRVSDMGAIDYIVKPFSPKKLAEMVNKAYNRQEED